MKKKGGVCVCVCVFNLTKTTDVKRTICGSCANNSAGEGGMPRSNSKREGVENEGGGGRA